MKVSITMDYFPMLLLDMMTKDLAKHVENINVQVGGEDTVFVSFFSDDVVKVQIVAIICDKYRFGRGDNGSEILLGDEKP